MNAADTEVGAGDEDAVVAERIEQVKGGGWRSNDWFAYIKTRDFWIVLVLGQILALCLTATNTFSTLLVNKGTSIPAFQTFINYVFLNLIYTSYTIYKYGLKGYGKFLWKDGWKCKRFSIRSQPAAKMSLQYH